VTYVIKIISGGQAGVDQAALDAAITLNIDYGGWCPPGRICEAGKIPIHYQLKETPKERSDRAPDIPRSLRTEWNVRDADAILVLKPAHGHPDNGTAWTIQCAEHYGKPYLIMDPYKDDAAKITDWLIANKIKTLNVAGPGEKACPGIGIQSYKFLIRAFDNL